MSEQIAHVTTEVHAGACALDGEQLTAELLRENLELLERTEKANMRAAGLRRQCGWLFACLMTSICLFIILMAWANSAGCIP
ncbi:hypothetical protein VLF92_12755 [Pseudomonas chengduensis]